MYVNVAVLKETQPHERRVALVPSVAPKLIKLGAKLHMQSGAGRRDQADRRRIQGRRLHGRSQGVGQPTPMWSSPCSLPRWMWSDAMKEGAILISFIYADKEPALVQRLLEKKITCFAMETCPAHHPGPGDGRAVEPVGAWRDITRCSSARRISRRILPKITTAAGAIGPAKVLVMGLGVAGLEAIATAHRLGAVVEGYDVRPETEEQALSLGAKFVETGVDARGKGGYARELTPEEKAKVAAVLTKHIQQADLIITTAAIPGRPSPKLISKAQVAGMKAGAVIVDLSAEGGGNCEDTRPGETVADRPGDDRGAAERAVAARRGRQRALCEEPVQSARPDDEGQHHHDRLGRRGSRQDRAHPCRRDEEPGSQAARPIPPAATRPGAQTSRKVA